MSEDVVKRSIIITVIVIAFIAAIVGIFLFILLQNDSDYDEYNKPITYGVDEVYSGGENIIEEFVESISDELISYGVNMEDFDLYGYTYNGNNSVVYRLDLDNGDVLQLRILYTQKEVTGYEVEFDSMIIGDGPDEG